MDLYLRLCYAAQWSVTLVVLAACARAPPRPVAAAAQKLPTSHRTHHIYLTTAVSIPSLVFSRFALLEHTVLYVTPGLSLDYDNTSFSLAVPALSRCCSLPPPLSLVVQAQALLSSPGQSDQASPQY